MGAVVYMLEQLLTQALPFTLLYAEPEGRLSRLSSTKDEETNIFACRK